MHVVLCLALFHLIAFCLLERALYSLSPFAADLHVMLAGMLGNVWTNITNG